MNKDFFFFLETPVLNLIPYKLLAGKPMTLELRYVCESTQLHFKAGSNLQSTNFTGFIVCWPDENLFILFIGLTDCFVSLNITTELFYSGLFYPLTVGVERVIVAIDYSQ